MTVTRGRTWHCGQTADPSFSEDGAVSGELQMPSVPVPMVGMRTTPMMSASLLGVLSSK